MADTAPSAMVGELRKGMLLLGVRGDNLPSDIEMKLFVQELVTEHRALKVGELVLAFQLASRGKLDFQVETYQTFSVLYLNRLIGAYKRWALKQVHEERVFERAKPVTQQIAAPPVDSEEFVQIAKETYHRTRDFEQIFMALYIFDVLYKDGRIKVDPTLPDRVAAALKNKCTTPRELKQVNMRLRDDDEFERLCKRLAVAEYLDATYPVQKQQAPPQQMPEMFSIEKMLQAIKTK